MNPHSLRIEGGFTVENCEVWLSQLGSTGSTELVTPTRSNRGEVGGESAICQLIISWALAAEPARLKVYASDADDPQILAFAERLHGLVAALCCDEAFSERTGVDVRAPLLKAAVQRLELLQGPNPKAGARGIGVEIVCADHLPQASPVLFYRRGDDGSPRLRREAEFQSLAPRLLEPAIPATLRRSFSSEEMRLIGSLIFELFKNTEEHAKFDVKGNKRRRSVRGVMVRSHLIARDNLEQRLSGLAALSKYAEQVPLPTSKSANLQLLEISVFDSGPGYAARLRGTPISSMTVADEFGAVGDCFRKHISSKHESRFGLGLPYVLELLKEHAGFLRLRTGRLSLCINPSQPDLREPALMDVSGSSSPIVRAPVEGALVTLMLPLGAR